MSRKCRSKVTLSTSSLGLLVSAYLAVEKVSLDKVTRVKIELGAACGARVTGSRNDFHHSTLTASLSRHSGQQSSQPACGRPTVVA
jgi:hypothetical protein